MSENLSKGMRSLRRNNTVRKPNGVWPPEWGSKEYSGLPPQQNNKLSGEIKKLFSKVSGNSPKGTQQMKKYTLKKIY